MSFTNGIGANLPITRTLPTSGTQRPATAAQALRPDAPVDSVELSDVSRYLDSLRTNNIRQDKVADVRKAIASGQYETSEKLDATVDGLLEDLHA